MVAVPNTTPTDRFNRDETGYPEPDSETPANDARAPARTEQGSGSRDIGRRREPS